MTINKKKLNIYYIYLFALKKNFYDFCYCLLLYEKTKILKRVTNKQQDKYALFSLFLLILFRLAFKKNHRQNKNI